MKSVFVFFFSLFGLTVAHADVVNLGNIVSVQQQPNQKGAVSISGSFTKPITSNKITLTIKYKDAINNWVPVWCRVFAAGEVYSGDLKATFELPASVSNSYDIKMDLSAGTTLNNWQAITWQNSVNHYKQGDYTSGTCDLDEHQYTILLTPKKNGTVLYDATGNITGVKDRVNSTHIPNKLNDIVFSVNKPTVLMTDSNGAKSIKITNSEITGDLGATPECIYAPDNSHPVPYLYSYNDPVYVFAGNFSISGFKLKFSQWPGEPNGPGYHDFTNPNALTSRYFNYYDYIDQHLQDLITDQEPVVIVSSRVTGLRIYKSNGTFISLTGHSNYPPNFYFGYPPNNGDPRGPGSEDFIVSNTSEMRLYGMGAIRNNFDQITNASSKSLPEIEAEVAKFIKYVGIFGDNVYSQGNAPCANACIDINPDAQPDNTVANWTLAPNSYIFTGKDKNGGNVDGLYIPVRKAYAMWENGGEFMKNEQGNYTPIPAGTETAGVYWEDEPGLIKSVSLEGSGRTARIKVMVNKLKEGNAVISYRVDGTVYWTWHVWATDDPTNGSTYHHGFEKDKDGNVVTDWKWMDRNLGATNADFIGNDWHKSGGLQYQWGRKDPFPPLVYKDGSFYEITGEVGAIRHRNAVYTKSSNTANGQSTQLPVKFRGNIYTGTNAVNNTGFDAPGENIRYSVNNPINYILPPVYIYKLGEQVNNNGENYFRQVTENGVKKWIRRDLTNWFSKQKYKERYDDDRNKNIAWDLWGDIRGGRMTNIGSNDVTLAGQSSKYAVKSPYDPCPCNWRVPSSYATVPSVSKASPWGSHVNIGDETTFSPDSLNPNYQGIKIYPGLGFDFTNVPDRNIGKIVINGNYESYPNIVSLNDTTPSGLTVPFVVPQDHGSDGNLQTSTFSSGTTGWDSLLYAARGFSYISDPYNFKTSVGWQYLDMNGSYGNTSEAAGVRCVKDPNSVYMPIAFETEYVAAAYQEYALDTLKKWAKDANSYIADPAIQNRVIKIPLRKAYAMQKLYLSENASFPEGNKKTPAIEWTTNSSLISGMEIINGAFETDTLKVVLANGQFGNAVVGFHLGNSGWTNGTLPDPVMWSWHIWAPIVDPRSDTMSYVTESFGNNGIKPANQQFVNPVRSQGVPVGVPMTTTFMNMDLGALNPAPSVLDYNLIQNSGGLHYQWGRKDPLPVFLRPGGFWSGSMKTYNIWQQTGINLSDNSIVYSGPINENAYLQNFSSEYTNYASIANILPSDSKAERTRKVLKYATENPLTYMFHNADPSTNQYNRVKDWLSDENNLFMERWGHGEVKSPYDPCPEGWRVPDAFSAGSKSVENAFEKGTNPWFYNGYQVNPFNDENYGLSVSYLTNIFDEAYNPANKRYLGKVVANLSYPATRFVWVFQDNKYKIGNIANNGIRGQESGNQLALDLSGGSLRLRHSATGLWLASPADYYSGKAIHLEIDPITGGGQIGKLKAGNSSSPQAAMSCRCAQIKYDANNNEIGRYDPNTIAVPKDAVQKPMSAFASNEIGDILKGNKITVFPSPVIGVVHIDVNDDKDYYYQVYNMAGQLVKEGKFINKQTNLSSLHSGTYLIRINNSESVVKIVKL